MLKIVEQSYPFTKKGAFVYAPDCHNSVLGISEFAKNKGAAVQGFKFGGKNWTSSYDYDDLEDVMDSLQGRLHALDIYHQEDQQASRRPSPRNRT